MKTTALIIALLLGAVTSNLNAQSMGVLPPMTTTAPGAAMQWWKRTPYSLWSVPVNPGMVDLFLAKNPTAVRVK